MSAKNISFSHLKQDFPAGLVVFLVALPLCLGIALASGAPLFSGIIAGVIGGLVIGAISGSHTAVSGPAAGLTVIVFNAITELGSFELFLTAVLISGIFQVIMGVLKAGVIGYYFPTSVIKGMLAGIGIILIIKQIPYVFGWSHDSALLDYIPLFTDFDAIGSLKSIGGKLHFGAIIISVISLIILIIWERPFIKRYSFSKIIPGALVVVILGILLNQLFHSFAPSLYLSQADRVVLPVLDSISGVGSLFTFPDFSEVFSRSTWTIAITIAIIASLETLLSLEASDKIDPYKRVSPPNRELIAQGVGNMANGLIGGIPVTAVIVRSSANISAGGRTKMSAILHGGMLLVSVLLIPNSLNLIPLACLAAVLLMVGYKLTRVSLIKAQAKLGWDQFLPFFITILGIVTFDLLIGIGIGMVVALVFILLRNFQNPYLIEGNNQDEKVVKIVLSEEVSFLNKGAVIKILDEISDGKEVIIDGSNSKIIDYDVLEIIENFKTNAPTRDIKVKTINIQSVDIKSLH